MLDKIKMLLIATGILTIVAMPLAGQEKAERPDPLIASAKDGANYARQMITVAADQMSEEEYAYRPTRDVRSFGEILAHVADTNYWFCSAVRDEKPPVGNIEKEVKSRSDIRAALSKSFEYCEGAFDLITDIDKAKDPVQFMGNERPKLGVLNFRTYHLLLHYGNVITYMRLRGKVPPSSAP